jgi:hypothetical protein
MSTGGDSWGPGRWNRYDADLRDVPGAVGSHEEDHHASDHAKEGREGQVSRRSIIRVCNVGSALIALAFAVSAPEAWQRWFFGAVFGWYASAARREW